MIPTSIDGTDITGATIDGTDVQEITVDGDTVFSQGIFVPPSAVYHWPFKSRSNNNIEEVISGDDGTSIGTSNISGNFVEGFAESFSSNRIETTLLPNFTQQFQDCCVLLTVETTSSSGGMPLMGGIFAGSGGSSDRPWFEPRLNNISTGDVWMRLWGVNDDRLDFYTNAININDGAKHRIAINIIDSSTNNVEIFVDGSSQSLNFDVSDGPDRFDQWNVTWPIGARNNVGNFQSNFSGTIDNVILCDQHLTNSEISQDFNSQPWS